MIIVREVGSTRTRLVMNPTIDNVNKTVSLDMYEIIQAYDDTTSEWIDFDKKRLTRRSFGNQVKLDPATLLIAEVDEQGELPEGSVGVYDFVVGANAGTFGITDVNTGSVFEAMALTLNTFVQNNNLLG